MADLVTYEARESVAVITIDRYERRNAIDVPTREALHDAQQRFNADDEVDVGVLTGAEGVFCAGADLKEAAAGWPDADEPADRPMNNVMGFDPGAGEKPIIAAVEGYATAGGFELAAFCDLRVAAADATFGFYERRWGGPLMDGGTQWLPRLVGLGRALDLILTGRSIGAEEAHDWGLVDRVVPPGEALPAAVEMGRTIASFPQPALRTDRQAVYDGLDESFEAGLGIESWYGTHILDAFSEGAGRFVDGEGRSGQGTYEDRCDRDDV